MLRLELYIPATENESRQPRIFVSLESGESVWRLNSSPYLPDTMCILLEKWCPKSTALAYRPTAIQLSFWGRIGKMQG